MLTQKKKELLSEASGETSEGEDREKSARVAWMAHQGN